MVAIAPAHATGTALPTGEAAYTVDIGGTSYVATDISHAYFAATGTTPFDAVRGLQPFSLAYDPTSGSTYLLEYSNYGRWIERLDPSTGSRWASLQILEQHTDWIESIAISPTGAMYGLGDQGGLYRITLGSTYATLSQVGASPSAIAWPQDAMAFDPGAGFLYAYDPTSHSIKLLSLGDATTLFTYGTVGLPGGSNWVTSMQIDTAGHFWVNMNNPVGNIQTLYVGTMSGSTITFTQNGAQTLQGTAGATAVYGLPLLVAPALVFPASTPTVTGSPVVGDVVAAASGTWQTGTTFSYQWLRDGIPIDGATSATYAVANADGGHQISVSVTGRIAGDLSTARMPTTRTSAAVAALPLHMAALSHAQDSGQVTYGHSVTLSTVLSDASTQTSLGTAAVQLQRESGSTWVTVANVVTNGSGTASSTLAPAGATTFRWYVAARNTATVAYPATTSDSFSVKVVLAAATPTITGKARAGRTLTAHAGKWMPSGVRFAYQWYAGRSAIKGAKKATLKLSDAWVGKAISVRVTGSRSGYVSVVKRSASRRVS
jgi:hypothetical protein